MNKFCQRFSCQFRISGSSYSTCQEIPYEARRFAVTLIKPHYMPYKPYSMIFTPNPSNVQFRTLRFYLRHTSRAVSRLLRLVTEILPGRHGFKPGSNHVGVVIDKEVLEHVYPRPLLPSPLIIIQPITILIHLLQTLIQS